MKLFLGKKNSDMIKENGKIKEDRTTKRIYQKYNQ